MRTTTQNADPSPTVEVETALYLVVDISEPELPGAMSQRLETTVATLPVAALLLANPASEGNTASSDSDSLRTLIATFQRHDIATMVSNDPKVAKTLGADGIHLHWRASISADYEAARALGGGAMMIGADAGKSRHDAMVLAETEADYVAFGVPAHLKDQETARARQFELVAWWAEMFEVPVVAFDITTPDQAAAAKEAGADFVAATLPPNSTDQAQFDAWLTAFAELFPKSGISA